jgi:hypothetical protein
MVLKGVPRKLTTVHLEPAHMSILERPFSPHYPADGANPPTDRLRVITAGRVGNMDARLGASGFDVVAVAETEHALIEAVSADEPDAIVVEADLCESLEHVRDLAPDALVIVIGDHTPAGALGRIERGVSGTVMAGLLHALVAEGVGAAAVWGLVPAFGQGAGLHVSQRIGGWMLSAKADLLRAHLLNAFRDHAELVTVASTVAVTVSASLVLTLSAPRRDGPPTRVASPAVEHAHGPVIATVPVTPTRAYEPWWAEAGDRNRPAQKRDESGNQGRDHHDRGLEAGGHGQGQIGGNDDQGGSQGNNDQGGSQGNNDEGGSQGNDDQGGSQGNNDEGGSQGNDDQGENGDQGNDDQGGNPSGGGQGENQSGGDQGGNQSGDSQGENGDQGTIEPVQNPSSGDQGENTSTDDQGGNQDNDQQGEA